MLKELRELGFSWIEIGEVLGVQGGRFLGE